MLNILRFNVKFQQLKSGFQTPVVLQIVQLSSNKREIDSTRIKSSFTMFQKNQHTNTFGRFIRHVEHMFCPSGSHGPIFPKRPDFVISTRAMARQYWIWIALNLTSVREYIIDVPVFLSTSTENGRFFNILRLFQKFNTPTRELAPTPFQGNINL